ncbi:exodeoxyribonuclease VII small subunit [Marinospirillum sp. MEB164]|uniref:Exodeoxyribonuclease 7 small subunit n=1 Tax=Marinospirillum alkalitolerans TaxID=3123374 RepID=A0ABW8PV59_9GAMM
MSKTLSSAEATPTADFEQLMAELEQLVSKMEAGDLSLEASLEAYERGVRLSHLAQSRLQEAELRVQRLHEQSGQPEFVPLNEDERAL